jgi:hypothetical protein
VEQKYERQVKEIRDLNAQAMSDQQQKEKNLEKEVRQLRETLSLESRGMSHEVQSLQRKLEDAEQGSKRLQEELEAYKNEREKRIHDF